MSADQTTITLKPGMAALLRGLAQRQGRTVEWTAHEAIRRWLHAETAALHVDDDKAEVPQTTPPRAPVFRCAECEAVWRTETQRDLCCKGDETIMPSDAPQTTERPAPNTLWRARDGRLMRLDYWMPNRAKPTAFMVVINPRHRQRRYSEQAADGFGSFLQPEAAP